MMYGVTVLGLLTRVVILHSYIPPDSSALTCASGCYRVLDGLRPLNRKGFRARSGNVSTDGLSEMVHSAFRGSIPGWKLTA